jgi:hypothetical protein
VRTGAFARRKKRMRTLLISRQHELR